MQNDDNTQSFVQLTAGTRVAHYEIISKIGAGGMGEVYLAEDSQLDYKVALKFLSVHLSQDETSRARFTREAKAAAKLDHPNIVPVHELGEFQGRPFFAMTYIEGQSLREVIKQGKLTVSGAIDLCMQICEGLNEAHTAGVVHRDIKPGNIIIDTKNKPRILDFGLATVSGEEKLTKTGSTLGTVGYMSPEQITGKDVDHRSDIFSIGVILYEMLTGRRPFEGDNDAAVARSITDETPEPVSRYKSGVSGELQQIVDKALSKDPSLRYQHADGMLSDLRRLKTDTGQPATSKIGLWVGAAVMALAAAAALYSFWPKGAPVEEDAVKMLAVLPFENLGSAEDEYFADGITDEITSRLAKLSGLGVISRTSSMQYKKTDKTLQQIGAELGVSYILEGTILWDKTGDTDRVRIISQLIQVSDDRHLWSESYQRALTQIFALQAEIAISIANELDITLLQQERDALAAKPTKNLEAYDFYLRGNDYWYQSGIDVDMVPIKLAKKLYEQALNADPTYVPALAHLARTEIELYWHNTFDSTDLNKAWRYIQQALAIDSTSVETRIALGSYYYHDYEYDKALAEFNRVLERQPNNSDVLMEIAYVYLRRANFKEALKYFRQAAEFDPLRSLHVSNIAYILALLRRFDEAEKTYYQAIALAPDLPTAYFQLSWVVVSRDGDLKRARKLIADAERIVKPHSGFYDTGFDHAVWDGDFRSALRYSDLLRPFDGGDEEYHLRMAFIYRMQNKRELERVQADSAHAILKEGAGLAVEVGYAHQMLGTALARMGRFEEAIEHGKKGVELEKRMNNIGDRMYALAWIYLESGNENATLDVLEKILNTPGIATTKGIQLDPDWKPLHDNLRYKEMIKKYEIPSS